MYKTRRLGNCDHIGSAHILRAVFRIMRDTSLVRQDAESRKLSGLEAGAVKMFT